MWVYNRTALWIKEDCEEMQCSGKDLSSTPSSQQSVCLKLMCLQRWFRYS